MNYFLLYVTAPSFELIYMLPLIFSLFLGVATTVLGVWYRSILKLCCPVLVQDTEESYFNVRILMRIIFTLFSINQNSTHFIYNITNFLYKFCVI